MARKVLLVDDTIDSLRGLGKLLQGLEFKVAVAHDAIAARRLLARHPFDLVFVSVAMEGMDGIDFARRIRQGERTQELPVVMLAGEGEKLAVARAKKAGLGLFLFRPFEPGRLGRLLAMVLGGSQAGFTMVNGREIFEINCTTACPETIRTLIDETARQVRERPPKSVLTLTTLVHGATSNELVSKLSELARGNEPYVRKAAIVGVSGIYQATLTAVSIFSRREFKVCTTKEEALAYLLG